MAEGRQRHDWSQTASLMALIANTNRDPKKHRPFKPSDFDPFAVKKRIGIQITKDNIAMMRNFFVKGERP